MQKFNPRLFIALFLAASAVAFIFFINQSRTYKTEIDILILPRNEKTAQSLDQTVESIKQIPLSLSFYDKLLEINSDIEDGAAGLPDYKRKEYWNSKIRAERIGESGIIKFEVFDKNQWQSEITAFQLKNDIFFVISKYYNIKTDLEPRLIDGPITSSGISKNVWAVLLKSLGLGIVFGFVAGILISVISGVVSRKKEDFFNSQVSFKKDVLENNDLGENSERDFEYEFSSNKSAAEKALEEIQAEEMAYEESQPEEAAALEEEKPAESDALLSESAADISNDKKSVAPSNLPFAEEELPEIFNGNGKSSAEEKDASKEEMKVSYKEATPEEVQARIAKLLQGAKQKNKGVEFQNEKADNKNSEEIKAKLNGLLG